MGDAVKLGGERRGSDDLCATQGTPLGTGDAVGEAKGSRDVAVGGG